MKKVHGMAVADIATTFLVSERTVQRYIERFEQTGNVSRFVKKDGPNRLLDELDEAVLVQLILDKPGVYLNELQHALAATNRVEAGTATIWRTLLRLGFTHKKIKHLPMQRSDEARVEFMAEISAYDPAMLVWLDETGSDKRNAVREYGYALRGMTPRDYTFKSWGKRYTCIASMSVTGLEDVYITEGNVDGESFVEYVQRSLLPTLMPFNGINPKSVVIIDNASIHHVDEVISTIEAIGAIVKFLPTYSPDLNPVEEVFSEVKHWIKSNDIIFQSSQNPRVLLATAFSLVSQENCLSYIRDSGYIN